MKYVTQVESFSIPAFQGGLCVPRNARAVRVRKPDAEVLHWKHSSARGVEQELWLIHPLSVIWINWVLMLESGRCFSFHLTFFFSCSKWYICTRLYLFF